MGDDPRTGHSGEHYKQPLHFGRQAGEGLRMRRTSSPLRVRHTPSLEPLYASRGCPEWPCRGCGTTRAGRKPPKAVTRRLKTADNSPCRHRRYSSRRHRWPYALARRFVGQELGGLVPATVLVSILGAAILVAGIELSAEAPGVRFGKQKTGNLRPWAVEVQLWVDLALMRDCNAAIAAVGIRRPSLRLIA